MALLTQPKFLSKMTGVSRKIKIQGNNIWQVINCCHYAVMLLSICAKRIGAKDQI